MIKGITTSSPWLTIQNGSTSNYVNSYSGLQGVGNMRFNTTTQTIEVYDGNLWQTLNMGVAQIDLKPEVESLLAWARQERARQLEREQLIKSNPALEKAWAAIKRAEANFDILEKFVESDRDDAQPPQTGP